MRQRFGEERSNPGALFLARQASLEARRAFQLADEREQRTVDMVWRAEEAQPGMRLPCEAVLHGKHDVRLSDARLAGEDDNPALAPGAILPASLQQLEFLLTPERRRQPTRVPCLNAAFNAA